MGGRRRGRTWATLAGGVLAVAGCGKSADRAAPPPPAAAAARSPTTHPAAFDPGDLLEVRVAGLMEPGQTSGTTVRVQGDGCISVPLLVAPVAVAYADPAEAARRVAAAYRAAEIMMNAQVSVRRLDYPPDAAAAPAAVLWRPTTHPGTYDVGDLLEVRVLNLVQQGTATVLPTRVQADGTIGLELVAPVAVAGLTPAAAVLRIDDAYRHANVLSNPGVDVRRLQVAGTGGPTPGPIAPYDLVRCSVAGLLDGRGTPAVVVQRVDAGGAVRVPLVGPVPVAGLTDAGAAAALAAAYRHASVLNNADVSVLTLERAPADAAQKSLPDGPIDPVPPMLRDLYEPR